MSEKVPFQRFSAIGYIFAETIEGKSGVVINIEIYSESDRGNGEGSKLLQEYILEAISLGAKVISAVMLPEDPQRMDELAHFYYTNGFKRREGDTVYYDVI
jgi:hypothetical protein